jgi:hypothetical protein
MKRTPPLAHRSCVLRVTHFAQAAASRSALAPIHGNVVRIARQRNFTQRLRIVEIAGCKTVSIDDMRSIKTGVADASGAAPLLMHGYLEYLHTATASTVPECTARPRKKSAVPKGRLQASVFLSYKAIRLIRIICNVRVRRGCNDAYRVAPSVGRHQSGSKPAGFAHNHRNQSGGLRVVLHVSRSKTKSKGQAMKWRYRTYPAHCFFIRKKRQHIN